MVLEASTSGIWPVEAVAGVLARAAQNAAPATESLRSQDVEAVELTSPDAWARLLGQISTITSHGGGRILIRCIPKNGRNADGSSEYYLTIGAAPTPAIGQHSNLQPVRIVTDPNAPALQPQNVDRLFPWRQKDLLRELNRRLGRRTLNSYDIQAVRRQHHLDERPEFVFNLPGAGRRYSPAVADWIIQEHSRDPEFFQRARSADHDLMALRRRKPR